MTTFDILVHKLLFLHKWTPVETIEVYGTTLNDKPTSIPIYRKYVMQCDVCGIMKIKRSDR